MAKEHKCVCAGCTASAKQGALRERERIIELIKGAPVSFDWFQPFVGTKTLINQINGETND